MRKLVSKGEGWAIGEGPELSPKPGEAIVRVVRAPVVPVDLARAKGVTPGREFVGVVQSVGTASARSWEGKRVTGSSLVVCGTCDLCRAGLSAHCRDRAELGVDRDGALAERLCVPVPNLVELPRTVDDDSAAFAIPLALALHASGLCRLEGKPHVTIVGDGVVGLLGAQVMTQRNASVRVLGREPARYTLCERWGVKHRHIDEVGRRGDQDVVMVCSTDARDLETALRLTRARGTVVLLATPGADGTAMSLIREGEFNLIGSRGVKLVEAIGLLVSGAVEVRSLIGPRFKFAQTPQAIDRASSGDALRVLVEV